MKRFLTDAFEEEDSNVIVFGVPLGKSGRKELDSLRQASWFVETYDIDEKMNLLENSRVFDSGDLKSLGEITAMTKSILGKGKIPLMLGGSHLSSLYSIQAFPEGTKVVVFDAHCDLKDSYMDDKIRSMGFLGKKCVADEKSNDATWLRRLAEKINPKNIMLIGVWSGDENELNFAKDSGIIYYTSEDVRNRLGDVQTLLQQFTKQSDVYISLDIDVFDPSISPAVDHPEPNGISFRDFKFLLNVVYGRIAGLDVCCLKPMKENQITEFLAVRSIFEILGKI